MLVKLPFYLVLVAWFTLSVVAWIRARPMAEKQIELYNRGGALMWFYKLGSLGLASRVGYWEISYRALSVFGVLSGLLLGYLIVIAQPVAK